jgi:eukaryotic-like serine/threonine-protein kinase
MGVCAGMAAEQDARRLIFIDFLADFGPGLRTVYGKCSHQNGVAVNERTIFVAALEKQDPADRLAYLTAACGEDAALRAHIDTLLREHEELGSFLESPASGLAGLKTGDSAPAGTPTLQQLGDYRILREIGRGGMGIVYEAVQVSLGRRVALKVLPAHSLLDAKRLQRFQREAEAAARLHHTNIVPIYGTGECAGLHYFVMQYIAGQSLDHVLRVLTEQQRSIGAPGLSAPAGLNGSGRAYFENVAHIGLHVAEALDHAAQQGVLHRDIKPGNLLLDEAGHVWVTDFGLAKLTGSDDLTYSGELLGTLRYMAPERFQDRFDAASDVYSLGLTLYELLAQRPAYAESDRNKLIRLVTQSEPPRLRTLQTSVPRDLETIIHKAVEKGPAHRYATAGALAADLRRFLEDRPIAARPISALERGWRWCRRNPTVALLTISMLMLALAAVVSLAVSNIRIRQEAEQKANALRDKDKALEDKETALAAAINNRREAEEHLRLVLSALDAVYLSEVENRLSYYEKDANDLSPPDPEKRRLERDLLEKGVSFYRELAKRESLDPEARSTTAKAYRRVAWLQLSLRQFDKCEDAFRRAIVILEKLAEGAASSADYNLELADTYHWLFKPLLETNRLSEAEKVTRQALRRYEILLQRFPREPRAREGLVHCYRNLGALFAKMNHPAEAKQAYEQALANARDLIAMFPAQPDSGRLRAAIQDHLAELLDKRITARNAGKLREFKRIREDIWDMDWGPAGRELALVRYLKGVEIFDAGTFERLRTIGDGKKIISFAFNRNPNIVALSEQLDEPAPLNAEHPPLGGGRLRSEILDLRDGKATQIEGGLIVRFSPDGKLLATQGHAKSARIWSVPEGTLLHELDVDTQGGITPEFSPDGKILAVGNRNGYTCLFDVATGKRLHTLLRAMSHGLKFRPDGKTLAVSYVDGSLALWNVADAKLLRSAETGAKELYTVDWSINGEVLATAGRNTVIKLWKASDLSVLKELQAGDWIIRVRFSPDGSRLLSTGGDDGPGAARRVQVWGLPGDKIGPTE